MAQQESKFDQIRRLRDEKVRRNEEQKAVADDLAKTAALKKAAIPPH